MPLNWRLSGVLYHNDLGLIKHSKVFPATHTYLQEPGCDKLVGLLRYGNQWSGKL